MADLNPPVQATPHLALPLPGDRTMLDDVPLMREALEKIDAFALRLDTLLNSDDVSLDELQELVAAIKANRGDILDLVASKLSIESFVAYRAEFDSVLAAAVLSMTQQLAAQNLAVSDTISQAVLKTGSTMTGPLELSGDPTQPSHAARMAWVENKVQDMATSLATLLAPKIGDIVQGVAPPDATWKLCNGAVLLQSAYPALFAKIGYLPNTFLEMVPPATALPTAVGGIWASIARGNGVIVALSGNRANENETMSGGLSAAVFTSTDGAHFVQRTLPASRNWTGLTFGAGLFVAISSTDGQNSGTATIATSPDGIAWTVRANAPGVFRARSIAYGNSRFVVVSMNGGSATSADGITWTWNAAAISQMGKVVFGAGSFVAASLTTTAVWTSTDGVTWTARTYPHTTAGGSLDFLNGKFVITNPGAATIYQSTNGQVWVAQAVVQATNWIAFFAGSYYMGQGATAYKCSATFTNFQGFTSPSFNQFSAFFEVSPTLLLGTAASAMHMSPDGFLWTTAVNPAYYTMMAYGAGKFIAINGQRLGYYSTDAYSWLPMVVGGNPSAAFISLAFNGTMFIALNSGAATYATSTDGINWTDRALPAVMSAPRAVAWGGGCWIIVGTTMNVALRSLDGINWDQTGATGIQSMTSVAYGAGVGFVVLSQSGSDPGAAWSIDGVTWTAVVMPKYNTTTILAWTKVAFGGGKFVAIGGSGASSMAAVSQDGRNWQQIVLPFTAATGDSVNDVAFGDKMFIISVGSNPARLVVSTDTASWTNRRTGLYYIYSLLIKDRRVVTASANQTVYKLTTYDEAVEFSVPDLMPPPSSGQTQLDYYIKAAA